MDNKFNITFKDITKDLLIHKPDNPYTDLYINYFLKNEFNNSEYLNKYITKKHLLKIELLINTSLFLSSGEKNKNIEYMYNKLSKEEGVFEITINTVIKYLFFNLKLNKIFELFKEITTKKYNKIKFYDIQLFKQLMNDIFSILEIISVCNYCLTDIGSLKLTLEEFSDIAYNYFINNNLKIEKFVLQNVNSNNILDFDKESLLKMIIKQVFLFN